MPASPAPATMNAPFSIQFAGSRAEHEEVFRLRYRVYAEEMGVYRSDKAQDTGQLEDAHDATSRILYAKIGGKVVGALRIHIGSDGPLPDAFMHVYDLPR